jgi:hypothetical protein
MISWAKLIVLHVGGNYIRRDFAQYNQEVFIYESYRHDTLNAAFQMYLDIPSAAAKTSIENSRRSRIQPPPLVMDLPQQSAVYYPIRIRAPGC